MPGLAFVKQVGALLERIGATRVEKGDGEADVGPILQRGVPGLALDVDDTKYFWYHHSSARHDDGDRSRRFREVRRDDGGDGVHPRRPRSAGAAMRHCADSSSRCAPRSLCSRAVAPSRAQQPAAGQLVADTVHSKALESNLLRRFAGSRTARLSAGELCDVAGEAISGRVSAPRLRRNGAHVGRRSARQTGDGLARAQRDRARDDRRDAERPERVRRQLLHELGDAPGTGTTSSRRSSSRTSTGSTARSRGRRVVDWPDTRWAGTARSRSACATPATSTARCTRMSGCCTHFSRRAGRARSWDDARRRSHVADDVASSAVLPEGLPRDVGGVQPESERAADVSTTAVRAAATDELGVGRRRVREVGRARAARHDSDVTPSS